MPVTYRVYPLSATLQSQDYNEEAPTYYFRYNLRGNRLNLYEDNPRSTCYLITRWTKKECLTRKLSKSVQSRNVDTL